MSRFLYKAKKGPQEILEGNIEAESEIRANLFPFTDSIENACLEECNEKFPIKTCQDNFIIIREGSKGIIQENNCV